MSNGQLIVGLATVIAAFLLGAGEGYYCGQRLTPHATIELKGSGIIPAPFIEDTLLCLGRGESVSGNGGSNSTDYFEGLVISYLFIQDVPAIYQHPADYCPGDPRWHLKISGESGEPVWSECWGGVVYSWKLPKIEGVRSNK